MSQQDNQGPQLDTVWIYWGSLSVAEICFFQQLHLYIFFFFTKLVLIHFSSGFSYILQRLKDNHIPS